MYRPVVFLICFGSFETTRMFEKRLDGCYTRLLMKAKNISCSKYMATVLRSPQFSQNVELVLPAIAWEPQTKACPLSSILPWRVQQTNRGRRPLTFLDTVARDAGLDVREVRTAMLDRAVWRHIIGGISTECRQKVKKYSLQLLSLQLLSYYSKF